MVVRQIMTNTIVVLLCFTLTVVAHAAVISDSDWQVWKTYHSKSYADEDEEHMRYVIWNENLKYIVNHAQQNHSYVLAMNQFGDLTVKEFTILMNGYRPSRKLEKSEASTFLPPSNTKLPAKVDWRPKGYVTKVKNQKQCGSCWAFSTTGSLEGQHFKKSGKLVSLSEQNLVDCSDRFGNEGCDGGLMDDAFRYIKANGGIDTEASYPYHARDQRCKFNTSNIGADDTGFVNIPKGNEKKLQVAVATIGPISVAIDASHQSFQFYHKGVYDEPMCSSVRLDHGVLVVGYGTLSGQKYWIVKNSWAASWGDEGYINMSRDKKNQCGIATSASYPLV